MKGYGLHMWLIEQPRQVPLRIRAMDWATKLVKPKNTQKTVGSTWSAVPTTSTETPF